MTITTTTDSIEYTGTGNAPDDYPVPYVFWEDEEVVVTHLTNIGAGVSTPTLLVDGANYTITGGEGGTGTINVTTPTIETDELLLVQRVLPVTQTFSFDGSGAFPTSRAQEATDRCVAISQQVDGSLSVNNDLSSVTDLQLAQLTVEEELDGTMADFQITKSAFYNIFGTFQVSSNFVFNSPLNFRLHIGPLGTIGDPEINKRTIFFPGVTANTIYTFPVAWLRIFLSSNQRITFGADTVFSLLTIKAGSSVRLVEYVEKT